MSVRVKKPHAAFKHGAYSATAVLLGEDEDAFRELHQRIVVGTIARLLWRKQNLPILRIVEFSWLKSAKQRPLIACWRIYRSRNDWMRRLISA